MTGNVIAWFGSVDWGSFFAAAGLAITTVGGAMIGLYRQWKLTHIEIRERERRLREMPVEQIDPDKTQAAEQLARSREAKR